LLLFLNTYAIRYPSIFLKVLLFCVISVVQLVKFHWLFLISLALLSFPVSHYYHHLPGLAWKTLLAVPTKCWASYMRFLFRLMINFFFKVVPRPFQKYNFSCPFYNLFYHLHDESRYF
jgi:hypothetical protein